MRKSFDGLVGLITNNLKMNPLHDGIFVFINKTRDKMKILLWDRHGYWLLYKRLEDGKFQIPPIENGYAAEGLSMCYEQLIMILEGIDLSSINRRKRYAIN
jgi:transposase